MVAAVDSIGVPSESMTGRWQAALDRCRANPSFSKTARGSHGQATPGRSFYLFNVLRRYRAEHIRDAGSKVCFKSLVIMGISLGSHIKKTNNNKLFDSDVFLSYPCELFAGSTISFH